MMDNGYATRTMPGGVVEMVLTGRWSSEAEGEFSRKAVDRLVLNYALGFEEVHLEFLRNLPLRELVILDRRLTDLDPVYSLADTLEVLHLTTAPSLRLDVQRLPRVRNLAVDWAQISEAMAASGATLDLNELFVGAFTDADFGRLSNVRGLLRLILKDKPRLSSLDGLAAHSGLKNLEISLASRLSDISELRSLRSIEVLQLEACRQVNDLSDMAGCTDLRKLNVSDCGDLRSFSPLANLKKLQALFAYGSTRVVDADLSPIAGLPALEELRMQDRRTYRPRVVDIQEMLRHR